MEGKKTLTSKWSIQTACSPSGPPTDECPRQKYTVLLSTEQAAEPPLASNSTNFPQLPKDAPAAWMKWFSPGTSSNSPFHNGCLNSEGKPTPNTSQAAKSLTTKLSLKRNKCNQGDQAPGTGGWASRTRASTRIHSCHGGSLTRATGLQTTSPDLTLKKNQERSPHLLGYHPRNALHVPPAHCKDQRSQAPGCSSQPNIPAPPNTASGRV